MEAYAPGRVNLIGDHTDYSGGLVCPMAIDMGTTVVLSLGGDVVELASDVEPAPASVPIDVVDAGNMTPAWARYVAGVVAVARPTVGGTGRVSTTLPVGAGLSSSAALEVATALALGVPNDDPVALALLCQRAEHLASGVPCGIMDQLVVSAGVAGHALVIDCTTLEQTPVAIPDDLEVLVVHSGMARTLVGSAYAERRASVEAAARELGAALTQVSVADVSAIGDALTRARARHVVTENSRVREFAAALQADDRVQAGELMRESHASLRDDFEVSTPELDTLVSYLSTAAGVWGARLTGAGFGGCVVALAERGVAARLGLERAWRVAASAGAAVVD